MEEFYHEEHEVREAKERKGRKYLPFVLSVASSLFLSPLAHADDLRALLGSGHAEGAYRYEETRLLHLDHKSEPWRGSGMLYLAPKRFVVEQQKPSRLLLAVEGSHLWLFDAAQGIRRTRTLGEVGEQGGPMAAMQAAMAGDADWLTARYGVESKRDGERWLLHLLPKGEERRRLQSIEMHGRVGQGVSEVAVNMVNGDRILWRLTPTAEKSLEAVVKKLIAEARRAG